ncbi:YncE family protein [Sphingomonas sp. TREG-RG-20F-R18-01]|uniref:YncE family protein n=1 Tax=Sphingomonas sp. TREG-RG-20F-R18-01 TaxID=2914982 RepID=UPI001F59A2E2|nr:YncE family protein [Sphingomonas sp. TREG-RG-20F-R18-01]
MPRKLLLASLAVATMPLSVAATSAPTYTVAQSIAGPDGSWDYARADEDGTHVYVARSTSVTVIDTATGKVSMLGTVQRGHAVVPLRGGKLLVTSGTDGTVRLFDTRSGAQTANIVVGKKPDAAILDASGAHAFVMNADSGTVSVIDLAAAKVTRTISVKPALEYAAFGSDGTLFINNEDSDEIETVDATRGVMGKAIPLPGCKAPTGLGYDVAHGRLIAACANGKAAIVDARSRRLTALVDIGVGPDAVIMDEARGLAFIPCGKDGVLDILSISGSVVTHAGAVKTEVGARTGALDPKTGAIYLPTAKFDAPAAGGGRPAMVPGSFHVLVVKRA